MHKKSGKLLCTLCTLYFQRCYTNNRKPQYIINFCYDPISNKNNTFSRRESAELDLAVSLLLYYGFMLKYGFSTFDLALDKDNSFMYNLIYTWCDSHEISSQYPNPMGYSVFPLKNMICAFGVKGGLAAMACKFVLSGWMQMDL